MVCIAVGKVTRNVKTRNKSVRRDVDCLRAQVAQKIVRIVVEQGHRFDGCITQELRLSRRKGDPVADAARIDDIDTRNAPAPDCADKGRDSRYACAYDHDLALAHRIKHSLPFARNVDDCLSA